MKTLIVLVALCLFPALASAQTVTGYKLRIYLTGATAPLSTVTIPASSFVCGQTKTVVTGTPVNPTRMQFDDPADTTKDCVYIDNGAGALVSMPVGWSSYQGTLAATDGTNETGESTRGNFTRTPGAPANVRFSR